MIEKEQEARDFLDSYDFSHVNKRLISLGQKKALPFEISKKKCDEIEEKYKAFLFVCWKYRGDTFRPPLDADEFWHNHILFTREYTKFCNKLFGTFLHHSPD